MDRGERARSLTEAEFKRTYRMSKDSFERLLSLLRDDLTKHAEKGLKSSWGIIRPELMLSLTLRCCAGAWGFSSFFEPCSPIDAVTRMAASSLQNSLRAAGTSVLLWVGQFCNEY